LLSYIFFFQSEDGIRDFHVTGVQTCALPIFTVSAAEAGGLTSMVLGLLRKRSTSRLISGAMVAEKKRVWWRMVMRLQMRSTSGSSEERRGGRVGGWRS